MWKLLAFGLALLACAYAETFDASVVHGDTVTDISDVAADAARKITRKKAAAHVFADDDEVLADELDELADSLARREEVDGDVEAVGADTEELDSDAIRLGMRHPFAMEEGREFGRRGINRFGLEENTGIWLRRARFNRLAEAARLRQLEEAARSVCGSHGPCMIRFNRLLIKPWMAARERAFDQPMLGRSRLARLERFNRGVLADSDATADVNELAAGHMAGNTTRGNRTHHADAMAEAVAADAARKITRKNAAAHVFADDDEVLADELDELADTLPRREEVDGDFEAVDADTEELNSDAEELDSDAIRPRMRDRFALEEGRIWGRRGRFNRLAEVARLRRFNRLEQGAPFSRFSRLGLLNPWMAARERAFAHGLDRPMLGRSRLARLERFNRGVLADSEPTDFGLDAREAGHTAGNTTRGNRTHHADAMAEADAVLLATRAALLGVPVPLAMRPLVVRAMVPLVARAIVPLLAAPVISPFAIGGMGLGGFGGFSPLAMGGFGRFGGYGYRPLGFGGFGGYPFGLRSFNFW